MTTCRHEKGTDTDASNCIGIQQCILTVNIDEANYLNPRVDKF